MRVFLDTNVLVSGFATRGLSADVVRLLLAEHELVTSEVVLEETRRVLTEKFGVPGDKADQIESLLRRRHVEPVPDSEPPVEIRDPDDEIVLASAIAAEAEILITGDKDLLDIADQVDAVRIMTPRTFWEEVR
ncbi:putative toxin-antitoxin system toxin component, PIN family [Salinibacter sp. 10B]|uniref:putative toxin-antitoxin system toxin component, PIN family n=1 Tax=Salinibacter sp. 10B TaxID=1923971 RepID=UPI000CF572B5|nr:putative toxin-antitoxin system toxin component, PIN family [Salinibacter sp. 10B]PQJ26889.1 putative toxin-antitoxin system toxin component, PIN family [Salinibacter sp. 10B]